MIGIEGLAYRYAATSPSIVSEMSVQVAPGEIVALVGASGSGKSTILYLAGLLLTPTEGSVTVCGQPTAGLNDIDRSRLRSRHISFVFQDALLDPRMSVLDNIVEGAVFAGLRPDEAAKEGEAMAAELGVEVDLRRRPGQISGGQAQRINLARALVRRTEVVLVDEPTGNLDDDSASVVIRSIALRADRGTSVLVATHDSRLIEAATRTVALS